MANFGGSTQLLGETQMLREKLAAAEAEVERLREAFAKQRKAIEVVKARIVLMRECAEADLLHVEGLHRAAPARAIREADKALAALEGKPYKEEKG